MPQVEEYTLEQLIEAAKHSPIEAAIPLIFKEILKNQYLVEEDPESFQKLVLLWEAYKKQEEKERIAELRDEFFDFLLEEKPQNDEILHWYIWEWLGWKIPRKRICKDHGPNCGSKAPFEYVADCFFERVEDVICFANRTGGKTLNTAILNHLDMAFKDECEIASAGATKDQAGRMYKHFTSFHKDKSVKELLAKDPTKSASLYDNDSFLEIITASEKGLNSPHPQKARIDEVELIDWDVLQEGMSMTVSKPKINSGMVFLCVTGDTLIDVPRDRELYPDGVPICDLVGNVNQYLYSFSFKKGGFTLAKSAKIWKTKRAKVWKLNYKYITEDGIQKSGSLRATPDHLILLRNGEYKELKDLLPGDSLMSFPERQFKNGYAYVNLGKLLKNNKIINNSAWCPEYRYVYGKVNNYWPKNNKKIKEHIHHKDFRKINDSPENLERMLARDHLAIHNQSEERRGLASLNGKLFGGAILAKYNKDLWSEDGDKEVQQILRNQASKRSKSLWKNEYERMCMASKKGHTPEAARKRSNSLKGKLSGKKNPMYRISYENHPKGFLGGKHTKEARKRISEYTRNKNLTETENKIKDLLNNFDLHDLYEVQKLSLSAVSRITGFTDVIIKKALKRLKIRIRSRAEANKLMWNYVDKTSFSIIKRIQAYYQHGNIKAAKELEESSGIYYNCNHTVVSVEPDKIEDVYDIEVPSYLNFVANGLVLHNSTRKSDTGTFQRLLDNSKQSHMDIYAWCIWEALEKCTRQCKGDPKYGDCILYRHCKGIAHECDGFYKINDLIRKYRTMSSETFETQWLNRRPSREVLVYGNTWDEDFHIIDPIEPDPKWIVVSGIDFGTGPGHPFVYSKYFVDIRDFMSALDNLHSPGMEDESIMSSALLTFYLFYEYRSAGNTLLDHAKKIQKSPHYEEGEIIFADPSNKQGRIDLEELYGVPTLPADNALEDGIDMLRLHLRVNTENGVNRAHFYIFREYEDWDNPELIGTDKEFKLYKYPRAQDGKVIRRKPIPIHDHGLDIARYVVKSATTFFFEQLRGGYEEVEQPGFWYEYENVVTYG